MGLQARAPGWAPGWVHRSEGLAGPESGSRVPRGSEGQAGGTEFQREAREGPQARKARDSRANWVVQLHPLGSRARRRGQCRGTWVSASLG